MKYIHIIERIFCNPENESAAYKSLFDFLRFEIELRVESLKCKLEDLETSIKDTLDKFKTERHDHILLQESIFCSEQAGPKPQSYFQTNLLVKLKELEKEYFLLDKHSKVFEKKETFESLAKLKKLNISASHIGYLYGTVDNFDIVKLKSSKMNVEIIDVRNFMHSVCGLTEAFIKNNPQKLVLISTDFAANDIKLLEKYECLLNDDLKIQSVVPICDGFRRNKITQYYALCNNSFNNESDYGLNSVYVCDMELHRILIFDMNLKRY